MIKGLTVLSATIQSKNEQRNLVSKGLVAAFGSFYYAVAGEEASLKTGMAYTNFNPQSTLELWKMGEAKLVKPFVKLMLPYIQYKKMKHIARHPGRSWMSDTSSEDKKNLCNFRKFKENPNSSLHWKFTGPNVKSNLDTIKVRVLSANKLDRETRTVDNSLCGIGLPWIRPNNQSFKAKKVILHFHGGGFVAMSSFSMQIHTRV